MKVLLPNFLRCWIMPFLPPIRCQIMRPFFYFLKCLMKYFRLCFLVHICSAFHNHLTILWSVFDLYFMCVYDNHLIFSILSCYPITSSTPLPVTTVIRQVCGGMVSYKGGGVRVNTWVDTILTKLLNMEETRTPNIP